MHRKSKYLIIGYDNLIVNIRCSKNPFLQLAYFRNLLLYPFPKSLRLTSLTFERYKIIVPYSGMPSLSFSNPILFVREKGS